MILYTNCHFSLHINKISSNLDFLKSSPEGEILLAQKNNSIYDKYLILVLYPKSIYRFHNLRYQGLNDRYVIHIQNYL